MIPIGGSNAVGATGYAYALAEIADQVSRLPHRPTTVVFASSSGGTYAGLLAGTLLRPGAVDLLGVRVDLDPDPETTIAEVAAVTASRLGLRGSFTGADVRLKASYVGEGYGAHTPAADVAIREAWRREGILLDPVYTGKAASGLLDLARRGAFEGRRVVFLHTGGEPSVFARP